MIFKTGMLYISVVMQILLGSFGQMSGEPLQDYIELEPSDIKEMLALDSELEAMQLAPQMLSTMVQVQSSFTNYPQITGYQLTPSNIIVFYDTSFFIKEDTEDYSEYYDCYYPDEPSFYDENGDIVFQDGIDYSSNDYYDNDEDIVDDSYDYYYDNDDSDDYSIHETDYYHKEEEKGESSSRIGVTLIYPAQN